MVELHLWANNRPSSYTNEHGFDVHTKNIKFDPEITYAKMLDHIRQSFKINGENLAIPLRLDSIVLDTRKGSTKEIAFIIDEETNLIPDVFRNLNVIRLVAAEIHANSLTNGMTTPRARLFEAESKKKRASPDIAVRHNARTPPPSASHEKSGGKNRKTKEKISESTSDELDRLEKESKLDPNTDKSDADSTTAVDPSTSKK